MVCETSAPCLLLPWDTAFWGVRIGRVQGDRLTDERVRMIHSWCRNEAIRCLYFLARADDLQTIHLAWEHNFMFVDVRMTFRQRVSALVAAHGDSAISIRPARPDDGPVLGRIARESYRDTRFYFDGHFERERADTMYEIWIQRNCQSADTFVLVAERDGAPAGYISGHRDAAGAGSIALVGVDVRARGRGIGQALVQRALAQFASEGHRDISVITQGRNDAAQRLYQRSGFVTHRVETWYHRWYTSEE